jgi:hypothetical protein
LNNTNYIALIIKRILKLKFLIILIGIIFGILLFLYAKKQPKTYTGKSTFYPLNSPADKNSSTSKLTELIGGGKSSTGNLSEDANVNIEEVARSRKTRNAVCAERLIDFDNKTIAELLIKEQNKYVGFFGKKIEIPNAKQELINVGSEILEKIYVAKFNKQNLLELLFTHKNKDLISPISYKLVAKISQFYKELKIKKATIDYNFMQMKYDSLSNVLENLDRRQIELNERTLFVKNKIKYTIPEQNIANERLQILAQKNNAAANVEEAHRRLEKETPIIEILDSPEPPFLETKVSPLIYSVIGFVIGILFSLFVFTFGLIYKLINQQVTNSLASTLAETPKA